MIGNAFTRALNERNRLPHTIILITSAKFFSKQETFLPSEADKKIRWIFKEIDHLTRSRRADMPYKAHMGRRLRILWVQVLPIHADVWKLEAAKKRDRSPFPERLTRFNKLLSKICLAKNHHFVQVHDIIDTDGKSLSRYTGNPTDYGFELLYRELTRTIKGLDVKAKQEEKDKMIEDELKYLKLQSRILKDQEHDYITRTPTERRSRSRYRKPAFKQRDESRFPRHHKRTDHANRHNYYD